MPKTAAHERRSSPTRVRVDSGIYQTGFTEQYSVSPALTLYYLGQYKLTLPSAIRNLDYMYVGLIGKSGLIKSTRLLCRGSQLLCDARAEHRRYESDVDRPQAMQSVSKNAGGEVGASERWVRSVLRHVQVAEECVVAGLSDHAKGFADWRNAHRHVG